MGRAQHHAIDTLPKKLPGCAPSRGPRVASARACGEMRMGGGEVYASELRARVGGEVWGAVTAARGQFNILQHGSSVSLLRP